MDGCVRRLVSCLAVLVLLCNTIRARAHALLSVLRKRQIQYLVWAWQFSGRTEGIELHVPLCAAFVGDTEGVCRLDHALLASSGKSALRPVVGPR